MNISDFLPNKREFEKILAQGLVSKDLWTQVNRKREKMNLTWNELLSAMFKAFNQENGH